MPLISYLQPVLHQNTECVLIGNLQSINYFSPFVIIVMPVITPLLLLFIPSLSSSVLVRYIAL